MAIITSTPAGGAEVNVRDDYIVGPSVLGALNAEAVLECRGSNEILIDLRTAAAVATVSFEGSIDGTNYVAVPAVVVSQNLTNTPWYNTILSFAFTVAANLQVAVPCSGFRLVRARVSAYTSGTVTVVLRGSIGTELPIARPPYPAIVHGTNTAAVNTAVTLTLASPGTGLRHYIKKLKIDRLYSVLGVAAAAANNVTTTNLVGAPIFPFGQSAAVQGTIESQQIDFEAPMAAAAQATATTFVAPAQLQTIWRVSAWYYVAP